MVPRIQRRIIAILLLKPIIRTPCYASMAWNRICVKNDLRRKDDLEQLYSKNNLGSQCNDDLRDAA